MVHALRYIPAAWLSLIAMSVLSCMCACREDRLGKALDLAGENRAELERVLDHYRDDSLKLEAARFLIENMPGLHSMEGEAVILIDNG